MAMCDNILPSLKDEMDQRRSPTAVENLLSQPASEEWMKEDLGTAGWSEQSRMHRGWPSHQLLSSLSRAVSSRTHVKEVGEG